MTLNKLDLKGFWIISRISDVCAISSLTMSIAHALNYFFILDSELQMHAKYVLYNNPKIIIAIIKLSEVLHIIENDFSLFI